MTEFSLDEWLDSVSGKTVRVTATDTLGHPRLYSPQTAVTEEEIICPKCDDTRMLIKSPGETSGHCPVCGHEVVSALALGTSDQEEWEGFE